MHTIDVIVATYNWPDALERTLIGFSQQTDLDFSIVIADDGSDRVTGSVVKGFAHKNPINITHCWQEDRGFRKARILNKAMKRSQAQQVIFTDQDSIPHPSFAAEHRKRFIRNGVLVGGYLRLSQEYCGRLTNDMVEKGDYVGQVTNQRQKTLIWKHLKHLFYIFNPLHSRRPSIMGLNFSLDRQTFLAVNGFDVNYEGWGQEDSDLANRLWRARKPFRSFWHLCLAFHQWHPEHSTKKEKLNRIYYKRLNIPIECENGFRQVELPVILYP
jgi:GT2 family glycosyltransferase